MTPRRVATGRQRGAGPSQPAREWVGGCLSLPFFVGDRSEPYRPDLVLWVELPDGLVVGQAIVTPEDREGAVARALRGAMTQPAAGPPRQPDVIRVADAVAAVEVRAEVAGAIPVTVAPTPELDALRDHLVATLPAPDDDDSYFARGRVSAAAVEKLFEAGRALFAVEPWMIADEREVIRMDIPALGIDGACLSIIGRFGETRGVIVFPSLDDFERLVEGIRAGAVEHGATALHAEVLGLTFEPATDLPPAMRREAMEHRWPVAGADAYPVVERRDPDGTPRPLLQRDVEIATACAGALGAFFVRHAAVFESDTRTRVRESYTGDDGREVRLTVPYEPLADDRTESAERELDALLETAPAEPFRPRAGRNEPCPCGSGRKYKKCHLPADEAEHAGVEAASSTHALDERLVIRLCRFAQREFGKGWEDHEDDFADADEAVQLARPWSVYCYEVDGRTVVDAYLDARGRRCSREERRWLDAQRAAWLSVWEVEAVDPGKTLTLHDLLSGERRTVRETSGSKTVVTRHALLGRVVDHDGVALLCGVHQRPLPPVEAAEVIRRARNRLRRRRAVPVERLRGAAFGRNLIRYWEEAVEDLDARRAIPPDLRNRDGDPLLLTVDHFEVERETMAAVAARVADMEDAHLESAPEDSPVYVFLRPDDPTRPEGEQTIIGRVRMDDGTLRIETNSRARADALRRRMEAACGARIRHRAREHTDPLALARDPRRPRPAPASPSPEQEDLLAEFKARHYAEWIDRPLPALNGKTPRESARTAAGQAAVDLLLKDMEHKEQRAPGVRFDFSTIRRALGIATLTWTL